MWVFRQLREPITRSPRSSSLIVGRPMGKPWVLSEENEFFVLQNQSGTSAWRIIMKGSEDNKNREREGQNKLRNSPGLQSSLKPPLSGSHSASHASSKFVEPESALTKIEAHIITEPSSWQETMAKWEWLTQNVLVICSFFDRTSLKEETELWNFLLLKLKSLADEAREEYKKKLAAEQQDSSEEPSPVMPRWSPTIDEDHTHAEVRIYRSSSTSAPSPLISSRESTPQQVRKNRRDRQSQGEDDSDGSGIGGSSRGTKRKSGQMATISPPKDKKEKDDVEHQAAKKRLSTETPDRPRLSFDITSRLSDGEVSIFSDHDMFTDSDTDSSNGSDNDAYLPRKNSFGGSVIGGKVALAGKRRGSRSGIGGNVSISKKKTRAEVAKEKRSSKKKLNALATLEEDESAVPTPPPAPVHTSKATRQWSQEFSHLPSDHIIAAYRCILSRSGSRRGRIFASLTRIYFCAKKFRTRIVIPWNEVAFFRPGVCIDDEEGLQGLSDSQLHAVRLVTIHDEEFLFLDFPEFEEMLILFSELRRLAIERLNLRVTSACNPAHTRPKRKKVNMLDPFEKVAKDVMFARIRAETMRQSFRLSKDEQCLHDFDATLCEGLFTHTGSLFMFTRYLCFRSEEEELPAYVVIYLGDIMQLKLITDESILRIQTRNNKIVFELAACAEVHSVLENLVAMFKTTNPSDELPKVVKQYTSLIGLKKRKFVGPGPILHDHTQFRMDYQSRQAKQKMLWELYIEKHGGAVEIMHTSYLATLIQDGISDELRGPVWQLLLGSVYSFRESKEEFHRLLKENKGKHSIAKVEIEKDIHRSFNHPFFESREGRKSLKRVLTAYSWKNPQVGYCQSMNIWTAVLLLFMSEEEAFSVLDRICEELLPQYFTPDMIGSVTDQHVFEDLIEEHFPTMNRHLQGMNFPFALLSFPWFLCLFVGHLPLEATLRVWDRLFYEGGLFNDTTFLFKMGLALLKQNELAVLSQGEGGDIAGILKRCNYNIELLLSEASAFTSVTAEKVEELRTFHKLHMLKEMQVAPAIALPGNGSETGSADLRSSGSFIGVGPRGSFIMGRGSEIMQSMPNLAAVLPPSPREIDDKVYRSLSDLPTDTNRSSSETPQITTTESPPSKRTRKRSSRMSLDLTQGDATIADTAGDESAPKSPRYRDDLRKEASPRKDIDKERLLAAAKTRDTLRMSIAPGRNILDILGEMQHATALSKSSSNPTLAQQLEEEGNKMMEEERRRAMPTIKEEHSSGEEDNAGPQIGGSRSSAAVAARRLSMAVTGQSPLVREASLGEFAMMRLFRGGDQKADGSGSPAPEETGETSTEVMPLSARGMRHRQRTSVLLTESVIGSDSANMINTAALNLALPLTPRKLADSPELMLPLSSPRRVKQMRNLQDPSRETDKPKRRFSKSPRKRVKDKDDLLDDERAKLEQEAKEKEKERKRKDKEEEKQRRLAKEQEDKEREAREAQEKEKEKEKEKEREKEKEKEREREKEEQLKKEEQMKKKPSGTFIQRFRRRVFE